MTKVPRAPAGAKTAGRALWRAVLAAYELEEHELALLRQACRVADACDDLQVLVDAEGPVVAGRAHPALVELRQQRIVLARLIVALRVPLGEDEAAERSQYRGPRGVYGIRGAVS
jgi:hypothetical protein